MPLAFVQEGKYVLCEDAAALNRYFPEKSPNEESVLHFHSCFQWDPENYTLQHAQNSEEGDGFSYTCDHDYYTSTGIVRKTLHIRLDESYETVTIP